jgi:trimethylamine--corrinoid protein Co-methyltransferase
MGSTAPYAPLGALVMGDAEVISAMVLMQLACPGAPVFHAIFTSMMNPRTGGYISETPTLLYMMAMQLAHAWKVPSLGGARVSGDAAELGWQSGYEVGLGAGMIALAGGEICGLMGLVGGATSLYPEEVILDHQACLNVYDMLHDKRMDEIDPALEVIRQVGPRGHFLAQRHTRENVERLRLSPLFGSKTPSGEVLDARQVALEEFKRIAAQHHPRPLPDEALAELDQVLAAAEREAQEI